MDIINQNIKKIEQDLGISFEDGFSSYAYGIENGIISRLTLSDLDFKNFDGLSPVIKTVKALTFYNCTFNNDTLGEKLNQFISLESLFIEVDSIKAANHVLSMSKLQKLTIYIDSNALPKGTCAFTLKSLINVKRLILSSSNRGRGKKIIFNGIEHLSHVRELWLECDCKINGLDKLKTLEYLFLDNIKLQYIPKIKTLKTLDLSVDEDYEVSSLKKFENLENLKIQACSNINLGKLPKLKILIIQCQGFNLESTNCFNHLPNLEQLSLSVCDISVIKNLDNLKSLKMLDLSENEIESLEGLENLRNLEHLNLYDNKISDISILNKLPNLHKVNISGNNIEKQHAYKQVDNREIVEWLSRPYSPFRISIDKS